jgi:hypothetical protein
MQGTQQQFQLCGGCACARCSTTSSSHHTRTSASTTCCHG